MAPTAAKISKRQKKALAHHKGKGKAIEALELLDVEEENEILDDNEEEESIKSKKRKRQTQDDGTEDKEEVGGNDEDENIDKPESKMAKRRRKAREKKAAAIEAGEMPAKTYIVFVGNLPYSVTKEQIQAHFSSCGEATPKIRLLTSKTPEETGGSSRRNPENDTKKVKTKGYAFVEFSQASSLQAALKLHGTKLLKREINVELTAGGGGKSESRKDKLTKSREKLTKQREKHKKAIESKQPPSHLSTRQSRSNENHQKSSFRPRQPLLTGANSIKIG